MFRNICRLYLMGRARHVARLPKITHFARVSGDTMRCMHASRRLMTDPTIIEGEVVREDVGSVAGARHRETDRLEANLQLALSNHEALLSADSCATVQEILESMMKIIECYENLEFWDQALEAEESLFVLLENDVDKAACIYRQGKLHMRQQQVVEAVRDYKMALETYIAVYGDNLYHADIGNVLLSTAGVHFHRGRLDESLQVLNDAEPHFQKHGLPKDSQDRETVPHEDLIKCIQHQGLIYRSRQDFQGALSKYELALEQIELLKMNNPGRKISLLLDAADMLSALEENDRALEQYESVLEVVNTLENETLPDDRSGMEGIVFHAMGKIHARKLNYPLAREYLLAAAVNKEKILGECHPELVKTLNALGAVHVALDEKVEGEKCFQRSLLISRMFSKDSHSDPEVLFALRNIAFVRELMGSEVDHKNQK